MTVAIATRIITYLRPSTSLRRYLAKRSGSGFLAPPFPGLSAYLSDSCREKRSPPRLRPTTLTRRPTAPFDLAELDASLPKSASRPLLVRLAGLGVVGLRAGDLFRQLLHQLRRNPAIEPQRVDLGGNGFVDLAHRPLRIFPPSASRPLGRERGG